MDTFKLLIISAFLAVAAVIYASVVPTAVPPAFTTPPSTGTTVPLAGASLEDLEAELIDATNRDRHRHGLAPLHPDTCLNGAAREWVDFLAQEGRLMHRSDAGLSLWSEVDARCPGRWAVVGENLGRGPTISEIQGAFMASPTHRENILELDYTHLGVAVTFRPDNPAQLLLVVHFGTPRAHMD